MPRTPDPNSPAREHEVTGDCIAEISPELLERIRAYHNYEDPPDTHEPVTPIPEREE
jgi:hypothetical protein